MKDLFSQDFKSTNLTLEEIKITETILSTFVSAFNDSAEKEYRVFKKKNPRTKIRRYAFVIDFKKKYIEQFIPVINKFGEKEVWTYCFCNRLYSKEDLKVINWENLIIVGSDGGSCFFRLKVNLS